MRLPLFEFEDQSWFPAFLRDYQTDFLGFIDEKTCLYLPAQKAIAECAGTNPKSIVDLASGAGHPAISSTHALREKGWNLILTDRFPNANGIKYATSLPLVKYLNSRVDLLLDQLPEGSIYTMFNAFHHFSQAEKLEICKAVDKRGGTLLVFEPLQPGIVIFLKVLFATTIGVLLAAPFIKPFSTRRLFFTYMVPLGLIFTCWDGLVSVLKALSPRGLKEFKEAAKRQDIAVSYTQLPGRFAKLTFIKIG